MMQAEYDFSKGERGKFYHPNLELKAPIYLEGDVGEQMSRLADESGIELNVLVNEWLRRNLDLIASVKRMG
ncbi:MAG: hypothetical protein VKJ64_22270 [Leptolyngbyaceae bacterium]|nr:hypothetical protein [Leptolyngbyaceae bacterium]